MTHKEIEITKEEYEKALKGSPYDLIDDSIKMGYGVYGASVVENSGKHFLIYDRGSSCD